MSDLEKSEWVGVGEAADIMHVSPKTMNRWLREGRIPSRQTLGGPKRPGWRKVRRDVLEKLEAELAQGEAS